MKQVLFLTNYPAPYRVRFFDRLGETMDVTVLYTTPTQEVTERDPKWYIAAQGRFRWVQLSRKKTLGGVSVYTDVVDWVRKPYGAIVVCGYSDPTFVLAMVYMRLRGIRFCMEVDGGVIRRENRAKFLLKRSLVSMAHHWLSTGEATTAYLAHYGAKKDRITTYPFSSLEEQDLYDAPADPEEKAALRRGLNIPYKQMVLTVGQFIPRKGFDVLLQAAADLEEDTGIYIVGGEATREYIQLRERLGLTRVHFVGFQQKEVLARYYRAADVFVLPTREDIWGLVINEAMAYGLPVITTENCVAGRELVRDGVNGYLVPVEDSQALARRVNQVLAEGPERMGRASLERIRPYTIENMVKAHEAFFESGR